MERYPILRELYHRNALVRACIDTGLWAGDGERGILNTIILTLAAEVDEQREAHLRALEQQTLVVVGPAQGELGNSMRDRPATSSVVPAEDEVTRKLKRDRS